MAPAPYRVLLQQGTLLVSVGPDGQSHLIPLPDGAAGGKLPILEPGGRGIIMVASAAGGDRLYLVRRPGQSAEVLPLPPAVYGTGPWREVAVSWAGDRDVVALLANAGSGEGGVLARYSVDQTPAQVEGWRRLPRRQAQLAALSPDALQVARTDMLPGTRGFSDQVLVRLYQVAGKRSSVALQYLGAKLPQAILWSPDGGTLAIQVPGQGLAIQKSSGRPVRSVPDGQLPAAFSPRGAALAYVSGSAGAWQIHVLNLHGEIENVLASPAAGTPTVLGWTPDARGLIYGTGHEVWQVDPANGAATKLAGAASGSLVGVIPASSPFAR
jgi:hypothetical protein